MLRLIEAARSHISHFVLTSFAAALVTVHGTECNLALRQLCHLFALTQLSPQLPTCRAMPSVSGTYPVASGFEDQAAVEIDRLLTVLRREAIGLTDAWDFSDGSLASAIGCRDGDAYERLISWTRQLPINQKAREEGGFATRESWNRNMRPALEMCGETEASRSLADKSSRQMASKARL